jgi:hypothetical protein
MPRHFGRVPTLASFSLPNGLVTHSLGAVRFVSHKSPPSPRVLFTLLKWPSSSCFFQCPSDLQTDSIRRYYFVLEIGGHIGTDLFFREYSTFHLYSKSTAGVVKPSFSSCSRLAESLLASSHPQRHHNNNNNKLKD